MCRPACARSIRTRGGDTRARLRAQQEEDARKTAEKAAKKRRKNGDGGGAGSSTEPPAALPPPPLAPVRASPTRTVGNAVVVNPSHSPGLPIEDDTAPIVNDDEYDFDYAPDLAAAAAVDSPMPDDWMAAGYGRPESARHQAQACVQGVCERPRPCAWDPYVWFKALRPRTSRCSRRSSATPRRARAAAALTLEAQTEAEHHDQPRDRKRARRTPLSAQALVPFVTARSKTCPREGLLGAHAERTRRSRSRATCTRGEDAVLHARIRRRGRAPARGRRRASRGAVRRKRSPCAPATTRHAPGISAWRSPCVRQAVACTASTSRPFRESRTWRATHWTALRAPSARCRAPWAA